MAKGYPAVPRPTEAQACFGSHHSMSSLSFLWYSKKKAPPYRYVLRAGAQATRSQCPFFRKGGCSLQASDPSRRAGKETVSIKACLHWGHQGLALHSSMETLVDSTRSVETTEGCCRLSTENHALNGRGQKKHRALQIPIML